MFMFLLHVNIKLTWLNLPLMRGKLGHWTNFICIYGPVLLLLSGKQRWRESESLVEKETGNSEVVQLPPTL